MTPRPRLDMFVSGTPRPKQSFEMGQGHGYTKPVVKAWADTVGWRAREHWRDDPLTGDVKVELNFWLPTRRRKDCDNLSKAVLDAMNGIVYDDDTQVHDLHITKGYDKDNPGVRVRIYALLTDDELAALDAMAER